MSLLFGTQIAAHIQAQLKAEITEQGLTPCLAVLLVGHDPASELYVALKMKAAEEVGIKVVRKQVTEPTSTEALQEIIRGWNIDPTIHGILVQLPLPNELDTQAIIDAMDPAKDVDGFHPTTIEALKSGSFTFISPVHESVLRLLAKSPLNVNAAKIVILANSDIFASPLASLLKRAGAFVTIFTPDETDKKILAHADAIIIAIGRKHFLNPTMTKRGAVIIDVGTNRQANGVVAGDVDAASYADQPETIISAVPGGIGPLTIAHLLKNTVLACQRANQ